MAKVIIGAEIKVDGLEQASQSVGSFKKQLREATNDLQQMADKFGINSKEAAAAAQKVAGLKDAIGDAKALAETFNPDKKFVALGGAVQGVTAGFSAFTGAMGLLGTESKEVEKLLLKVQSAMALQQGLSGVKGAVDSFKLLGNTIKTQVVTAFSTLKGAIIATGIGALVVAIAAVAAAFENMAQKAEGAAEAQKKLNEETQRFANIGLKSELDYLGKKEKLDVARAKLAGKTESEIFAIQQEFRRQRIAALQREYKETKGIDVNADNEKLAAIKNAIVDGQVAEADNILKIRAMREAANKEDAEKRKAANDKRVADEKAAREELAKLAEQYRQAEKESVAAYIEEFIAEDARAAQAKIDATYALKEMELQAKADLAELALLNDPDSIENKLAKEQADFELEMLQFQGNNVQRQILEKQHSDAIVAIKAEEAEAKKQIGEKELEYQNTLASGIANSLDTLAGIAGKQTAAGKALAIASTVIKTIQGGIAAFTGMTSSIPGPVGIALGVVAAAGVVAAGVKAVKQITAVKIPGAPGPGGGAPSISLPTAAPIRPQAQTTRLDQGSINAVGNAANRAYVLETDVSGNQERIRRLNRAARIN